MEVNERSSTLNAVLNALRKSPDTPWYLVALVEVSLDLIFDVVELQSLCNAQLDKLDEQHRSLEQLQTKYSEVLYHLKTVKE